jgi:NTP pyrophosphatase (non-canonical NTP hydrolase)
MKDILSQEEIKDYLLSLHIVHNITEDILSERIRQIRLWDRKWCEWNSSLEHKSTVLLEEVGEVAHAVLENDIENLREELIQVAAVCVAWVETLDNELEQSKIGD